MSNVFVNGRLALNAGDGLTQTCPVPDVCKTPSPGGPVPVPYVNVAQDSDLAKGTKKVTVEGKSVALQSSNLSTSTGDEAGTAGGGIISSKTKGKLTWATYSPDVKFEGKSVVRFLDICLHNGNQVNTGGNAATGKPSVGLTYGADQKCPICGKEAGHELKSNSETSEKEAQKLYKKVHKRGQPFRYGESSNVKGIPKKGKREGFMAGVLLCRPTSGARTIGMQMHSGRRVPKFPMRPSSLNSVFERSRNEDYEFKTAGGRTVRVKADKNYKGNPPGICAAPRMIAEANERGYKIVSMTEFWIGPPKSGRRDAHHYESCSTCKQILPAMLCDAKPDDKNEPITITLKNPPTGVSTS
jgi:hypothetical protein